MNCRIQSLAAGLLGLFLIPAIAVADCPRAGLSPIAELKGESGAAREGERVLVRGVVTGDFRGDEQLGGFYLQDEERGIFVYAPALEPGSEPVASGREVVVAARAGEYRGQRQLSRVSQVLGCNEPGLPAPVELTLPEEERDRWQALEGRLVTVAGPLTVTGNYDLGRYGSLDLVAGERLFHPNNGVDTRDNPAAHRLVLDDAHYRRDPDPIPYLDEHGTRRVGDTLPELTGILTRAFDQWRVHPLEPDSVRFEAGSPRPAPPDRRGRHRLAAFNVENYFLTLGERGAADAPTLDNQRAALEAVVQGLDADLLALIEVENDPGAAADLVDRLGRHLPDGRYRHFGLAGRLGRDAIRNVIAWRPDRISLLAGPFIDDDPIHNRPVLAGHFRFDDSGQEALVAVIHHKAKSGCPNQGDVDRGQGCWNQRRIAQSRALAEFLRETANTVGSQHVLILGDINAYGGESPVNILSEAGWQDLIARHRPPEERYSYVYRGQAGYLDAALASPELAEQVQDARFWAINADEPRFLRFQKPGPWRSSDHDPVIVDLVPTEME